MIAKDILDDLDYLGESTFYRVLGMTEGANEICWSYLLGGHGPR
ncbi:MAG: hypothetical protein Ct9H300mP28_19150 [Pseudomonadota bacterium]|nr:MAG: hypothetical protein Ct9H300mP28_19150 [Pseudomonadota bacterium]